MIDFEKSREPSAETTRRWLEMCW